MKKMRNSQQELMLRRAKKLRRDMTPEEKHLWYDFLRKYPVHFYRQRIIDGYIVDFYCPKAKLIVEVDGIQHYEESAMEYDKKRTRIFEAYGLEVLRVTNGQVNRHFKEVCTYINGRVEDRMLMLGRF